MACGLSRSTDHWGHHCVDCEHMQDEKCIHECMRNGACKWERKSKEVVVLNKYNPNFKATVPCNTKDCNFFVAGLCHRNDYVTHLTNGQCEYNS